MTIDWSKAPEGATHYDCRPHATPAFMQKIPDDSQRWNYWNCDGELIYYGFMPEDQVAQMVQRPAAWNGEGLPPVGFDALLKKECKLTEGTRLESFPAGTAVYVGGHANFGGCDLAVIIIKGRHFCGTIIPELLERVRTPEQIAADERKAGIAEIQRIVEAGFASGSSSSASLWDAGYRKQVAQ